MNKEQKKRIAPFALLLAAFTWGSAFLVIKDSVNTFSPVWFLALRFAMAALLFFVICIPLIKKITKKMILKGMLMGIVLYFEFLFFMIGIQYTTGAKGAFISASYVMILPLVYYLIRRKVPTGNDIWASFICTAGLALILFGNIEQFNRGDILMLLSAVCYAIYIVIAGVFTKNENPVLLNLIQILTGLVLSLGAAVLFGNGYPKQIQPTAYFAVAYLAIFCTILPYLLSLFGQKYVKTSTSGVLLSFESVFGCLCSVFANGDSLGIRFIMGAACIMLAFFISNQEPGKRSKLLEKRK